MSMKTANLLILSLMPLLLLPATSFVLAQPQQPTRISIVISNPSQFPQDVWVIASNSSGSWNGGGDICLVSGVIYALNQAIGEPLPPTFTDPNQFQIQMAFKQPFDGGWVKGTDIVITPGIDPTDFGNFFIEGAVSFNVLHGAASFNPELASAIDSIKTMRFTFDYVPGRSIQQVMFWFGIELAPSVLGYLPILEAYPRALMTVINTAN